MSSCYWKYGKKVIHKIKHEDVGAARLHAAEMTERHSRPYQVYLCDKCVYWHVGRKPEEHNQLLDPKTEGLNERLAGQFVGFLRTYLNRP